MRSPTLPNKLLGMDAGLALLIAFEPHRPRTTQAEPYSFTRILKPALLVALACMAVSCKKPQAADVPGQYNRLRTQGGGFLDLRADGTYVQVYSNSTVLRTNLGQWAFQAKPPALVLRNVLIIDDGPGHPATMAVTNGWKLNASLLAGLLIFEDPGAEPFARITAENQ